MSLILLEEERGEGREKKRERVPVPVTLSANWNQVFESQDRQGKTSVKGEGVWVDGQCECLCVLKHFYLLIHLKTMCLCAFTIL